MHKTSQTKGHEAKNVKVQ